MLVRELNARWVAKYGDFGPVEGCTSETELDGGKLVLITNRKSYNYELSIGIKIGDLK